MQNGKEYNKIYIYIISTLPFMPRFKITTKSIIDRSFFVSVSSKYVYIQYNKTFFVFP